MRNCESIMPGISLDIIVRKDIQSLSLTYVYETAVFKPRIKEFCLVIP